MSDTTLLSSLPYVDEAYDGETEVVINQMIADEMRNFVPPNYLEKFPQPKFQLKDLLAAELARVSRGVQLDALDKTRYQLEPPKNNDIQSWKQAVQNAQSQLEHQYARLTNLELLQTYGANAWKRYNDSLEHVHRQLSLLLEATKKEIEQLNVQRKTEQIDAGNTLRSLEAKWRHLVQKNLEIEAACLQLEEKQH